MKTRHYGLLTSLFALTASFAQAEERVFDLQGFSFINVSSGLSARVQTGSEFSVIAVSDSNKDLERLDIKVDGNILFMEWEPQTGFSSLFSSHESMVVNVTLPELTGFEASGGANMNVSSIEVSTFTATISSGANATVEGLAADVVVVEMATGANGSISGRCGELSASISFGANLSAKSLVCEHVEVEAQSGANLSAYASMRAVATASSGGNVSIFGTPSVYEEHESSGGNISKD